MEGSSRQLLLMRHAKSSWNNANISDHDRPLAPRGLRAAPEMGEWLLANNLVPDRILSSTACRANETARLVAEAIDSDIPLENYGGLYHASPESLMTICSQVNAEVHRLLIVAHNPGLFELVNRYTDHETPFPTAAIACLEATCVNWNEFFKRQPTLRFVVTPKEIDY